MIISRVVININIFIATISIVIFIAIIFIIIFIIIMKYNNKWSLT